jgi:hypothetical protein
VNGASLAWSGWAAAVAALVTSPAVPAIARSLLARDEIAAAESVEATNSRRVMSFDMAGFLLGFSNLCGTFSPPRF